jgi:hypothetical protein
MFGHLPLRALAVLAAGAWLAGGPAARAADRSVKDWQFLGAGGQLKAGTAYTLYNVTDKESLRFGKRAAGINLEWDKSKTLNNVKVVVEGGGTGPVKYGDKVAVHVANGGHLKYQKRDVGINLSWSKDPVYEFTITGGAKGTPVPLNATVGLYSATEKDFLIYADRPAGINLRWYKDRDKGGLLDAVKDAGKDLVKEGLKELAADFIKGK